MTRSDSQRSDLQGPSEPIDSLESPAGDTSPPEEADAARPGDVAAPSRSRPRSTVTSLGGADFAEQDERTVMSRRPPAPGGLPLEKMSPSNLGRVLRGQRLAHFDLEEFVGGGGMGAVFRAIDTQLTRTVALKVLSRDQGADDETVRRFRNEAQSAARLDHENIARVYYFGEDQGLHYIVFEFIEGVNVRDLVHRSGRLSTQEALSYTLQVADALAHAASRKVVHRDIKPSNIIITPRGRAKLVDMGLARLRHMHTQHDDLTASGVTLGTFDYISPEQARDPRNADQRSDIYSLGCTLFFMLTGQPPFAEGTVLQKLLQHQGDSPPDPRDFNPEVPAELATVIGTMLAKDPNNRYQTPEELVGVLVAVMDNLGIQPLEASRLTSSGSVGSLTRPGWYEKHLPWLIPVAVLLALVLAVEWLPRVVGPQRVTPPEASTLGVTPRDAAAPGGAAGSRGGNSGAGSGNGSARDASARPGASVSEESSAGSAEEPAPTTGTGSDSSASGNGASANGASPPATAASDAIPIAGSRPPASSGESHTPSRTPPERSPDPLRNPAPLSTSRTSQGISVGSSQQSLPSNGEVTLGEGAAVLELPGASGGVSLADLAAAPLPAERNGTPERGAALPVDPAPRAPQQLPAEPLVNDAESPATKSGIMLVGAPADSAQFESLASAVAAAKSGDVIELRYDGPRLSRPLALKGKTLTLRAASGYQPLVVFQPTESDPVRYPRQMIRLGGGQLTIIGISLQLDIPRELPAERWTLVELNAPERIELKRATLTIRNSASDGGSYHQGVTFFAVQPIQQLPSPSITVGGSERGPAPAVIDLEQTVARGEATFVELLGPVPFQLNWNNGLLITSERLLQARCGDELLGTTSLVAELDLNHLTAYVRQGLCQLTEDTGTSWRLTTEVNCKNSIVMSEPDTPLIEQVANQSVRGLREKIQWRADRNFYEGFNVFWEIHGFNADEHPDRMTLPTWLSFWGGARENQPSGNVVWRGLPPLDLPLHSHDVLDYELDSYSRVNPARGAASDGSDAGMQQTSLPQTPAVVTSEDLSARDGDYSGSLRR